MSKSFPTEMGQVLARKAGLLSDETLEVLLRDLIAEAQRRPSMQGARRTILAGALGEEKAEQLAKTNLSAAEIVNATETGSVVSFPSANPDAVHTKGVA